MKTAKPKPVWQTAFTENFYIKTFYTHSKYTTVPRSLQKHEERWRRSLPCNPRDPGDPVNPSGPGDP